MTEVAVWAREQVTQPVPTEAGTDPIAAWADLADAADDLAAMLESDTFRATHG